MPVVEVFPTVAALVHDVDGGVWAGIYPTPSDTTQIWLRFEDQQIDCRLELPRSFEPTEGARKWLIGVGTNELDIERVELWSIESD